MESPVPTVVQDIKSEEPPTKEIAVILDYLRRNNLKGTEQSLLREINGSATTDTVKTEPPLPSKSLESFQSSGSPQAYTESYKRYVAFTDGTLDIYKHELALLFYPLFGHMYLNLVYNNHEKEAARFFEQFRNDQADFYSEYMDQLKMVVKREHMSSNPIMETFRTNKYVVKMSRETFMHMKRFLQEEKLVILLNLVQDQIFIDTYDGHGAPRNRQQTMASVGSQVGETRRDANRVKVLYGLLKEPELSMPVDDETETEDGDKPKKKKSKKESSLTRKAKNDPNAPNVGRIPLPEIRDMDKLDKIQAYKEAAKRVTLGPNSLPSICFYTFLNSFSGVSCCVFTDDSSMLAAGFEDSSVRVWSLTTQRLRAMKSGDALSDIDKETDDILERMMDEKTASESKVLLGHNGPVYAVSFCHDRQYLLSSSEDTTIRLWSLLTWTNIVCYKGHNYPVYDVQFSNHGYYFVSAGHDRLGRLWSTDHYQPLRLFAGHHSDVECVKFHPNSNYIATGSADRTVRLFDLLNGQCVRLMSGHKGAILCLCFSPCGRYLASGGCDKNIHIWDLSNGVLLSILEGHSEAVISLAFSREGTVLASGSLDNTVMIWNVATLAQEKDAPDAQTQQMHEMMVMPSLGSFPTKATPVTHLHFTRRNLLLGAGPFRT